MIELRWLCATVNDPAPVLQFRVAVTGYDHLGNRLSLWKDVPCAIRHAGGGADWVRTAAHPSDVPRVVREGERQTPGDIAHAVNAKEIESRRRGLKREGDGT